MKFAAFALATILSSAAADFSLRAAAHKILGGAPDATADSADARIIVHGMNQEANAEDLDIIGTSLVSAYNHAYKGAGYSLETLQVQFAATMPENVWWSPDCRWCPPDDDTMAVKETKSTGQLVLAKVQAGLWWSPDCRWCPPDDDANVIVDAATLTKLHSKFENKFCADLRASASANLANARDCSFSFLDMPGQSDEKMPIKAAETFRVGEKSEAQVMLKGTLHGFSEKDLELIDQSVLAAYNEAFMSAGLTLGSFESVADLDVSVDLWWSPDCRWCPPDDDTMVADMAKLVMASVTPVGVWWSPDCRWCPPDDDATVAELSDVQLGNLHDAFEKSFCHKLQNSGAANFANVHDCSFRFVYGSLVEKETSEQ